MSITKSALGLKCCAACRGRLFVNGQCIACVKRIVIERKAP